MSHGEMYSAQNLLSHASTLRQKTEKKRKENPATCVDERSHSPPSVFQHAAWGVVHPSTVAKKTKKKNNPEW